MSKNVRMKKLFSLTLTLGLLFTCTACDKDNGGEDTLSTVSLAADETPELGVAYQGEKGWPVVYLDKDQYYQIGETVHQEMEVQMSEASGDVKHHEYDTTVHSITVTKKLDLSQWDTSKFAPGDLEEIQEDGTLKPELSVDDDTQSYPRSFVIVDLTLANHSGYEEALYFSSDLVYFGQDDGAIAIWYNYPTYCSTAPGTEKDFYKYQSSGNDTVDVTLMYYIRDEELDTAYLLVNMQDIGRLNLRYISDEEAAKEARQYLGAYRIMQEGTVTDE